VRAALVRARDEKRIVVVGAPVNDDEGLAEPEVAGAEQRIADEAKRRASSRRSEVTAAMDRLGDHLTAEQVDAARIILGADLAILTGGPGTGKSTLVRAVVGALGQDRCLLTAPTGRAARGIGGSTVHSASGGRLLRRPLQETSAADVPPDVELVVVDEASMLTTELMIGVFSLAPARCRVLLVGDPDQLPPVGAGNVFQDLLASGLVPTARLTYNHRSATAVQRMAQDVLEGRVPAGIRLLRAAFAGEGMRHVVRVVGSAPAASQVLTPQNATRELLNRALQSAIRDVPVRMRDGAWWGVADRGTLRTASQTAQATIRFETGHGPGRRSSLDMTVDDALSVCDAVDPLLPGDAVMVLKNQNKKRLYPGQISACNGDVGELVSAGPKPVVRFEDGTSEFPSREGWLTLAYAATVHKFQGSECDHVVLPVYAESTWDRHMLYTAITRAREGVTFVGTEDGLRRIVDRVRPPRHSCLAKMLRARV
jgi:exodeoxyribonuclease V alpha subunit